jgi:hypothetical protein
MRNTLNILIVAFCLLSFIQKDNPVYPNDFKIVTGINWTGTLTYLDYSSNKKHTIPAAIIVSQSLKNKNIFYFKYNYPKEPQENSIDTMIINKNSSYLGNEKVLERSKTKNGEVTIITQKNNLDDGIEKIFRYTYILSSSRFVIKKEEQKMKDTLWIERNIYAFAPK